MNHKILFVDDEKSILQTMKRTFRTEPYEVLLAESGSAGIELLKQHKVSVIVSDMRMPQMDGVAFLSESMNISPDATRIVLSGYAEKDSVMQAINQGKIWSFLSKPWENEEIKIAVKNAVAVYESVLAQKELVNELAVKNEMLKEMNDALDQKVKEKSWELQARAEALEMILETDDLEQVISKICKDVQEFLKASSVTIREPNQNGLSKYVIQRGERIFGYLDIQGVDCSHEEVKGFLSLIAIAMSMKEASSSPEMIENIDKFIDGMT